ncbi:MAG: cupin domain-containing protein [Pseudomonadota bacterium]
MAETKQPDKPRKASWDGLPKEVVRRGVERAGFRGEQVLLVMNWLTPGMEVNPHSHPFEQIAYIVQGRIKFTIEDEIYEVGAGEVIHIPANAVHCGEPIGEDICMNLDIFSPIREDYLHLVEAQAVDFTPKKPD